MLYARSLDRGVTEVSVCLLDLTENIVSDLHFCRQNIFHAGNRLFLQCHNINPLFSNILQIRFKYIRTSLLYYTPTIFSSIFSFLSIISSILSIYRPTSFTFSTRSRRFSFGNTTFVVVPAPQATMVCFSSIIKML